MKINKILEFKTDIEVEITAKELKMVLHEDPEGYNAIADNLNLSCRFLDMLDEEILSNLATEAKEKYRDFFAEVSEKFNNAIEEKV